MYSRKKTPFRWLCITYYIKTWYSQEDAAEPVGDAAPADAAAATASAASAAAVHATPLAAEERRCPNHCYSLDNHYYDARSATTRQPLSGCAVLKNASNAPRARTLVHEMLMICVGQVSGSHLRSITPPRSTPKARVSLSARSMDYRTASKKSAIYGLSLAA